MHYVTSEMLDDALLVMVMYPTITIKSICLRYNISTKQAKTVHRFATSTLDAMDLRDLANLEAKARNAAIEDQANKAEAILYDTL